MGQNLELGTLTLNVGCGDDLSGDVRVDFHRTRGSNVVADANHLPFKDSVFGRVESKHFLEHMKNPGLALKEQARVLRSGGHLQILTDSAHYWADHLDSVFGIVSQHVRYRGADPRDKHYCVFYPFHLHNLVHGMGLQVVELKLVDPPGHNDRLDRLLRAIGLRHLSFRSILVEAFKPEL